MAGEVRADCSPPRSERQGARTIFTRRLRLTPGKRRPALGTWRRCARSGSLPTTTSGAPWKPSSYILS
ncbi:hypothetical protein [Lysobacter gummosus]|uniref:hypothetical protein n=1 Tax=Lysobacter gummosus TaxID=262324 RepID=UPI000720F2E3|nr:hypothetical protein LG3211_0378 [Lysobacter gummosus]